MRDFPFFPMEFGVVNLTLKEIPYKKTAFIRVLSVLEGQLEALLKEAAAFCVMAGAEQVLAAWDHMPNAYPLHCSVIRMRAAVTPSEEPEKLFPVTDRTVSQWRDIYNTSMASVLTAQTLEARDEPRIVSAGAYFVHRNGKLLGIGWVEEDRLLAIASVIPGMGSSVLEALMTLMPGDHMSLEVASDNTRAINLYRKKGFVPVEEVIQWYRLVP